MDFSIGNLVKGVVGAIVGVAEAVLGATAEFADVCEDGEIDDEEAEELLEDAFKLLVGAFIGMFDSGGLGLNSDYSEEINCEVAKNRKDAIEPISGSKRLDTKDVDYLYGVGADLTLDKKDKE